MLFNTPIFFLFFAVFFFLYSFVFLKRYPRLLLILVGSLVFYAGWNYRFIPLLVLSAIVDYFVAIGIDHAKEARAKKVLLSSSIATNLGILGIFKYTDFAMQSVVDLVNALGYQTSWPMLSLVLPVGISFYTFQSMSYTIDVYRGVLEPRRGLLQFTAALAFFPQLVAGPILRARQILPQLEVMPSPTWVGVKHGFVLITLGLFKKTIADLLAGLVSTAFDAGAPVSFIETWTSVLAFAAQIYGDFSGYSDMAIGLGMVLGFKIPMNFRLPYLASSPVDFWRRWHISLSSWLRDYLYISLGGNRTNRYRNIMITMLLGGLWHGAAWNFVVWGLFHGALVVATHQLSAMTPIRHLSESEQWIARGLKWAVTFYLVLVGWVLFRAPDLATAQMVLIDMHTPELPAPPDSALIYLGLTFAALVVMHLFDWLFIRFGQGIERRGWLLWPILLVLQTFCFIVGAPSEAFIYFQF